MAIASCAADGRPQIWRVLQGHVANVQRVGKIIAEQEKPFRFVLSRVLWRLGISHLFVVQREGYRLCFFPTMLSATYWIDPSSRCNDEAFLKAYLGVGDSMVDVGANVGTIALAAATLVGTQGKVIAIEAHPRTFKYLEANARLNKLSNLTALNMAIGGTIGTIRLSDERTDDQNCVVQSSQLVVPLMTLDALLSDSDEPVALLKIDVEGYELPVLQGAESVLKRTECVYFESWEAHYQKYGYTCRDVIRGIIFRCGNRIKAAYPFG